jgi:hypothetical protein
MFVCERVPMYVCVVGCAVGVDACTHLPVLPLPSEGLDLLFALVVVPTVVVLFVLLVVLKLRGRPALLGTGRLLVGWRIVLLLLGGCCGRGGWRGCGLAGLLDFLGPFGLLTRGGVITGLAAGGGGGGGGRRGGGGGVAVVVAAVLALLLLLLLLALVLLPLLLAFALAPLRLAPPLLLGGSGVGLFTHGLLVLSRGLHPLPVLSGACRGEVGVEPPVGLTETQVEVVAGRKHPHCHQVCAHHKIW